ncbi:MAG: hypothetical protein J7K89_04825 [Candidatus Cloacimonetes bacterium]|nr:hypothetical protein [Candidatus Cloacimonadota bacterium]
MKYRIIFIALTTICCLQANIIIPGPVCNELMWVDGQWNLEMYNRIDQWPYPTLEECYLSANAGSSYFLPGSFLPYTLIVVDSTDLQLACPLHPMQDEIELGWNGSLVGSSCWITYGPDQYSMAPLPGESLVRKMFSDPIHFMTWGLYCRDTSPTMGESNDDTGCYGTFCGNVMNAQGLPLAGAIVEYWPPDGEYNVITDMNGEFNKEMYTVRYDIQVIYNEVTYIDTTICVAPDSTTYCDFVLPITSAKPSLSILRKSSLTNFPNPFNPTTNIQFTLPISLDDVMVEIFNNKGQKITKHSCGAVQVNTPTTFTWDGTDAAGRAVASGVYFARLMSRGMQLKECKMLLLK